MSLHPLIIELRTLRLTATKLAHLDRIPWHWGRQAELFSIIEYHRPRELRAAGLIERSLGSGIDPNGTAEVLLRLSPTGKRVRQLLETPAGGLIRMLSTLMLWRAPQLEALTHVYQYPDATTEEVLGAAFGSSSVATRRAAYSCAITPLLAKGLLVSPGRGRYTLTDLGQTIAAKVIHPKVKAAA